MLLLGNLTYYLRHTFFLMPRYCWIKPEHIRQNFQAIYSYRSRK